MRKFSSDERTAQKTPRNPSVSAVRPELQGNDQLLVRIYASQASVTQDTSLGVSEVFKMGTKSARKA